MRFLLCSHEQEPPKEQLDMILILGLFILGALTWSASEYILHRFVGHALKGRVRFSREHLAHHTDPTYFTPTIQKVLLALIWFVLVFSLTSLVWSLAPALSFTTGFLTLYTFYEVLHRRIHTHAPMGAYGEMVRKHHLSHHFTDARLRHGVTSRLWDRVFGTNGEKEIVRVPRKLATSCSWMLKDDGELRERYAHSYTLVGRKTSAPTPSA